MKNARFLIVILGILMFTACKKDDPAPDAAPIGFWKGKYGATTAYPTLQWSMHFKKDGTVRVYDGVDTAAAAKADGTYTISGNTVTTKYFYSPVTSYSTTATLSGNNTFLEGTFGTGDLQTGSGRFFLVKQ